MPKWVLYTIGVIIGLCALFYSMPFILTPGSKEASYRNHVTANLRSVGMGMIMYANRNESKFPDKLSDLYPRYIKIEYFFYPDEKKKIISPENINSLGSFEYFGSGLTKYADPKTVIAREKSNNHWKVQGRYELFVDGSVEWKGKPLPNTR